jgi:Flp pilus assembly protein TadD
LTKASTAIVGDSAASAGRGREARDPQAHVAVMQGWAAFRKNSPEAYEAAVALFQDAIRRDSGYAAAYAGLATVRHWQANLNYLPSDGAYEEARALAGRALALDSSNVDGWLVLGRIAELRDRDFALAERRFARAVAVAPSDARPYGRRAILLARLGRPDEALASAKRAVELDPASPAVYSDLARLYRELDRFADAERALRTALTLDPGHPILLGNLGIELAHQGKFAEAASLIGQARAKRPGDPNLIGMQAFVLARLGRKAESRALLDTADEMGLSPYNIGNVYEVLGDRERAIAMLTRAVREHDDGATALLDSTAMPSLRTDPRYRALVEEVRGRTK